MDATLLAAIAKELLRNRLSKFQKRGVKYFTPLFFYVIRNYLYFMKYF